MKITNIKVSSRYKKSFRNLSSSIQRKAIAKIKVFKENYSNSILKTHPLSGKDENCWSFWVDYHYRIKFVFLSGEEVLFLDIGAHDIYK